MKKTIILLGFLFLLTGGLVFLYSKKDIANVTIAPTSVSPVPSPTPIMQTTLSFSPNPLIIASASASLAISIDTGINKVNAVQIELSYDPKTLTNVSLSQGTFFSDAKPLLNTIDAKNGKVSYVLAISPTGIAQTGIGTIATLFFKTNLPSGQKTNITFTPKTLVTAEDIPTSVLKATGSATIFYVRAADGQAASAESSGGPKEETGPFKPGTGATQ